MTNTPILLIEAVERAKQRAVDRVELAKDKVVFEQRLQGFLKAAQAKKDAYLKGFESDSYKPEPETLLVAGGAKWIKIVAKRGVGSSVYCFVNAETGAIHKAASFKAPVTTNPRSNLFDTDFGASGVDWCGAVYLR